MKRTAIVVSLSAMLAASVAPGVMAQGQDVRLGHVFATDSPVDNASKAFARCVTDDTGGDISVTVFPDSQLGGDETLGRDLSRGGLELAFLNPGSLTGLDPLLDIHYLPYIVSSFEEAGEVFYNPDGVLQTTIREALANHGMKPLDFFELEFRAVTNSEQPVEAVSDLEGLKLRVPGSVSIRSFFDAAGVQTVTLPFPELFVALQQGTVDGQDNGASITYNSRLFEAQEYMTLTNHVYAMGTITASNHFWQQLSDENKDIISACASKSASDQIENNRAKNAEYLEGIREAGVEVHELSDEEMAKFVELGRSLWTELEDTYGADRIQALKEEVGASNE